MTELLKRSRQKFNNSKNVSFEKLLETNDFKFFFYILTWYVFSTSTHYTQTPKSLCGLC